MQDNNTELYFAYGSNMWLKQMNTRCPDNKNLGLAVLPKHRWFISKRGYANVRRSKKSYVQGVLYAVSKRDIRALDVFEGVASGCYTREVLKVTQSDGQVVDAYVYIDPTVAEGIPPFEYVQRIAWGVVDAKLDMAYVKQAIKKYMR